MSSSVFIGYACVLIFLMVAAEIDSQDCGQSNYENYPDSSAVITERGNAREGLWPWVVSITVLDSAKTSYAPHCSGFLIDRIHIISAAHCFENKDPELYKARIGSINQDEGEEYGISQIVVHPDYSAGKYYNDIAILTLEREVDDVNVNPICLPNEEVRQMNLSGRRAALAGFGDRRGSGGDFNMYLNFRIGLRVISNEQCEKTLRFRDRRFQNTFPSGISRDFICTILGEDEGCDVCMTSGGPLMIQNENQWFAVGITSFGSMCGNYFIPDGFTNIVHYLDWIRQNTSE